MKNSTFTHLVIGLVLFGLMPIDAHAYLDPGTGSYVLQLLVAGVLGSLFAIKMCWFRIKEFFGGLFGGTSAENKDADSSAPESPDVEN
jgi:hypothetical protein